MNYEKRVIVFHSGSVVYDAQYSILLANTSSKRGGWGHLIGQIGELGLEREPYYHNARVEEHYAWSCWQVSQPHS